MKGLTSNKLKIVAIMLMLMDHVGYYFVSYITPQTFNFLRFFGRMSMPIFVFLLVQGFFNTGDIKKYVFKLFVTATIFQLALIILGFVNKIYVSNYYIVINTYLNILYSFALCLITIFVIDKKALNKEWNNTVNFIVRIAVLLIILAIYMFINLELGYRVLITAIGFYLAEKIRLKRTENKLKDKFGDEEKTQLYYVIILFLTLIVALLGDFDNVVFNLPSLISIVIISLYNGERGTNNNFIKNMFYVIYPLHHVILYTVALCVTHMYR